MQTSIQPRELRMRAPPRRRALLAGALEAFREGRRAVSAPPAATATEALFREQMLRRLTPADRRALEMLAAPREHALALARGGKPNDAGAAMTLARFLLSLARFSDEGREYATTLHHAAESYLSFRRGDHEQALHRMELAIEATERLSSTWGEFEFIVCRRVHLAHNLMRVEAARGASRDALQRGARLLEYISVVRVNASEDSGAPLMSQMGTEIAEVLFDLVTQTIAELLVSLPVPDARAVLSSLCGLDIPRAWRGGEWLAIKSAAIEPDPGRFLTSATPFLRAGRGSTPTLWCAVALDLMQLCGSIDVQTADLMAEIRAELATGPRVPTCMRVPAAPQ